MLVLRGHSENINAAVPYMHRCIQFAREKLTDMKTFGTVYYKTTPTPAGYCYIEYYLLNISGKKQPQMYLCMSKCFF